VLLSQSLFDHTLRQATCELVRWCSWLSRQSNTLKVSGSNPGRIKLMAWGLFKKVVIADRLSLVVDTVYDLPHKHHGLSFVIATIFFSFQIFCDFSGYSDMAIGIARVMGFKLMKNFNSPYHAKSIKEFWGRWHISLSTWFKDYLYIPLGGNRVSLGKWCFNILLVFLISGLWHGANVTFVVWGALHGFYFIFAELTKKTRAAVARFIGLDRLRGLNAVLQTLTTFALVSFAWIFFRAKTINTGLYIVKSMLFETGTDIYNIFHHQKTNLNLGLFSNDLSIAVLSIILLEVVHLIQKRYNIFELVRSRPLIFRWAFYYIFLTVLVLCAVTGGRQFIYFQF